jgi:hypothetical protein
MNWAYHENGGGIIACECGGRCYREDDELVCEYSDCQGPGYDPDLFQTLAQTPGYSDIETEAA